MAPPDFRDGEFRYFLRWSLWLVGGGGFPMGGGHPAPPAAYGHSNMPAPHPPLPGSTLRPRCSLCFPNGPPPTALSHRICVGCTPSGDLRGSTSQSSATQELSESHVPPASSGPSAACETPSTVTGVEACASAHTAGLPSESSAAEECCVSVSVNPSNGAFGAALVVMHLGTHSGRCHVPLATLLPWGMPVRPWGLNKTWEDNMGRQN